MKSNELTPVILCGGSGTRLWPLSRESYPKQFLVLEGDGWSRLQKTVRRLNGLGPEVPRAPAPMVVCNAEHRFIAAQQLTEAGVYPACLLLEPAGRNTAPALTLAALQAVKQAVDGDDPVLLVMPAGSKWEVALPPEKAYGADPRTPFPPNVAVVFEIKLVSVK